MASLNPGLILQASQGADILGAMERGNALAGQVNEQRRQNALAGFLGQNAGALMQGDQNALAQYAQYDPQAAMDMMGRQQDRQWRMEDRAYARERDAAQDARYARQDERADREWQWKVEEYAAQKSQAERLAEAQQVEDAVKMGLAVPDAASWDAMMAQTSPDLVGQFDNRQALAQRYMTIADILKGQQGPQPQSPQGKFAADQAAGLLPADAVYQSGGNTTVNVGPNGSKFTEESDKLAAQRFGDIVTAGQGATQLMGYLQTLSGLAGQINTGQGAALLNRFGPYAEMVGVNIEGLPEAQAFQSITSRLAPQMRPAGSGSSSDTDVRMFLDSLPNLARTPEGNAIINETLQAVERHKIAAAEIAGQAQRGMMSWQDADQKIAALGNPYESFNKARDRIDPAGTTAPGPAQQGDARIDSKAAYDALPSGARFIAPDGSARIKP